MPLLVKEWKTTNCQTWLTYMQNGVSSLLFVLGGQISIPMRVYCNAPTNIPVRSFRSAQVEWKSSRKAHPLSSGEKPMERMCTGIVVQSSARVPGRRHLIAH